MKTFRVLLSIVALSLTCQHAFSQLAGTVIYREGMPTLAPLDLPVVSPENVPEAGNFFSAQLLDMPPLPFNPFPELTVYLYATNSSGDVFYVYDDRAVDYEAMTAEREAKELLESLEQSVSMNSLESLSGGGGFMESSLMEGGLCLSVPEWYGESVHFTSSGGTTGGAYDLMVCTDLAQPVWQLIARGLPDQTEYYVLFPPYPNAFFQLQEVQDSNTNGMSDAWEEAHFGGLGQDPSGDYDGDGVSNLDEYLNDSDPNSVGASFYFTSKRITPGDAIGKFVVRRGQPQRMAVLDNSSNFNEAVWVPYSQTFTFNPTTEGRHDLWVGINGAAPASRPLWFKSKLQVDATPPEISIISPASNNPSASRLQVKAHCPEPLAKVNWDFYSSSRTQTNQPAMFTKRGFDPVLFEGSFTEFDCPNVRLSEGTNLLVIHATDKAGLTSTTSNVFVFTTAWDTNPPAVTLEWPESGQQVSGDFLTFRGMCDDSGATVKAAVVCGSITNWRTGVLGRDGRFWIDNVPLIGTTNYVSLFARDVATNISTNEITIIRSTFVMDADPVPASQLNGATTTVTGFASTNNRVVKVNGVTANWAGDDGSKYYWQADNVPIPEGGTAVFRLEAEEPNTQAKANKETEEDKPPYIELESYHTKVSYDRFDWLPYPISRSFEREASFTAHVGGTFTGQSINWYQVGVTNNDYADIGTNGGGWLYRNGNLFTWKQLALPWEHSDWDDPTNYNGWGTTLFDRYTVETDVKLKLFTMGRPSDSEDTQRPLILTPNAYSKQSRAGDEIYGAGPISALGNIPNVDGNGKIYQLFWTRAEEPLEIEVSDESYRSYVLNISVERPPLVPMTRAYHPGLATDGEGPSLADLVSKCISAELILGLDADELIPDDDLRVVNDSGNTNFNEGLFLEDDVPVYVEFRVTDAKVVLTNGTIGPIFSEPYHDDKFLHIRTAQDKADLVTWTGANIKQVSTYAEPGVPYGGGAAALGIQPPLIMLSSLADGPILAHEWGHTRGVEHRGMASNPGPTDNALMRPVRSGGLEGNPDKVNRNERQVMQP
jgi:hypothetical protein